MGGERGNPFCTAFPFVVTVSGNTLHFQHASVGPPIVENVYSAYSWVSSTHADRLLLLPLT
jgi:hypothetical protein